MQLASTEAWINTETRAGTKLQLDGSTPTCLSGQFRRHCSRFSKAEAIQTSRLGLKHEHSYTPLALLPRNGATVRYLPMPLSQDMSPLSVLGCNFVLALYHQPLDLVPLYTCIYLVASTLWHLSVRADSPPLMARVLPRITPAQYVCPTARHRYASNHNQRSPMDRVSGPWFGIHGMPCTAAYW